MSDREGAIVLEENEAGVEMEEAEARPAPAAYELKVLGGRHSGAVIPLTQPVYSMGQDEECDLIFQDEAFQGGKVVLELGGEKPMMEIMGPIKAKVDGLPLITLSRPLDAYQKVEVGSTVFAIGPAGEPWPEAGQESDPEKEIAAGSTRVEGSAPKAERSEPETEVREAVSAPVPPPAVPAKVKRKRRRWLALLFVFLPPLLILACVIATIMLRPKQAKPIDILRGAIQELRLPEVAAGEGADGLNAKGFVATEEEKSHLLTRLSTLPFPVHTRVISAEETMASVNGVTELYQADFQVEIGPRGKVLVSGIWDNAHQAQEIIESIRQAVQPEVEVEGNLLPSGTVIPWLGKVMVAQVLAHKIKPEVFRGRLYAAMMKEQIDSVEMENWKEIKRSFKAQFRIDILDKSTDKASPVMQRFAAAAQELDADLIGVTVGDLSYITMRKNRKYFEGARLSSGVNIRSIRKDRIVIGLAGIENNYFLKKGTP